LPNSIRGGEKRGVGGGTGGTYVPLIAEKEKPGRRNFQGIYNKLQKQINRKKLRKSRGSVGGEGLGRVISLIMRFFRKKKNDHLERRTRTF